jgi:hypothetical protein
VNIANFTLRDIAEEAAKELLEKGVPAEVKDVKKENGQTLTGIMIGDGNVRPCVYVSVRDSVYTVVQRSLMAYADKEVSDKLATTVDCVWDFEKVKLQLYPFVINYGSNKEMLEEKNLVFRQFLDLAVGVKIVLQQDHEGIVSIKVGECFLEKWQKTADDVINQAIENHRKDMFFMPMDELLGSLVKEMSESSCDVAVDKLLSCGPVPLFSGVHVPMYVLSNTQKIDGAAFIADDVTIREVAKRLCVDEMYILPSSRGEVLIVPNIIGVNGFDFQNMVADVNRTVLNASDFLSDSVYLYHNGQVRITA